MNFMTQTSFNFYQKQRQEALSKIVGGIVPNNQLLIAAEGRQVEVVAVVVSCHVAD